MFPDLVYSLFQRPRGRPPYWRGYRTSVAAASTVVNATVTLPDDSDMILYGFWGEFRAGATQTIGRMLLGVTLVGEPITQIKALYPVANTVNQNLQIESPILVPRGTVLLVNGDYSAGVNANTTFISALVLHIPPMDV